MMYKVGIMGCRGDGLTKEMKETLSLFFPCHYFFQIETNLEVEIENYCKKTERKYTLGKFDEIDILIAFWDKKDERCKIAINNAHKKGLSTLIYYL